MAPRIAHVGQDRILMKTRSLVLRDAGFSVDEAYTLGEALTLTKFVDALLLCHSLPEAIRAQLIAAVRESRSLMPIICVRSYRSELQPDGCIGVESGPLAILGAVRTAIKSGVTAQSRHRVFEHKNDLV